MEKLKIDLQARLDQQAIHQLRKEVSKLAQRVERLEEQNYRLQECADQWREDFMHLQLREYPDDSVGITKDGNLVLVKTK